MELKGLKINFLGDSITEGCGTSDSSKRFPDIIAAKYGAICRNYGIGGTRIATQLIDRKNNAPDRCYVARVSEMNPDADLIVVFGGTNDYGHGDAPIGRPTDRTDETFYGAMHALCRSLLEKYSDSEIVFITPLHRSDEQNTRGDSRKTVESGTLKEYVDIIREVAEYYSLPVLDFYAESGIQPEVQIIKEKFIPDGLHPNDAGHVILANKIVKYIENL